MFIAAETLPALFPATSAQYDQLGLIVRSAPNVAAVNASAAPSGVSIPLTASTPPAAIAKPTIAGSLRDQARHLDAYKRSTTQPAVHCETAPTSSGVIA